MPETFKYGLSEDKRIAVIQFQDDDGEKFTKTFDVDDLTTMLRDLALLRALMVEPVPPDLDPVFRIDTIEAPAWRVPERVADRDGKIIALRHPGYGWLAFLLEQERSYAIARELLK